jgi:hypothetical protein
MNIDDKLAELRIKWKKYPELRDIIERQAKALKYTKKAYRIPSKEKHENRVSQIIDRLI